MIKFIPGFKHKYGELNMLEEKILNRYSEYIKVFVYGTLKQNYSNNKIIADIGKFIKSCRTDNKFKMFITSMGYPGIDYGDFDYIKGEIWGIKKSDLYILDEFEGFPDFYHRNKIKIDNEYVECYFITETHNNEFLINEYKE